jgi:hypothetical protein
MWLFQLHRAHAAAHFNDIAADRYFDGICIELAIASCTGSGGHDLSSPEGR